MTKQEIKEDVGEERPTTACSAKSLKEVSEMEDIDYYAPMEASGSQPPMVNPAHSYDQQYYDPSYQPIYASQAAGPVEGRIMMPNGHPAAVAYQYPVLGGPHGRRGSTASSHTQMSHDEDGEFVPMEQYHDPAYLQAAPQPTPYHMQSSAPPSSVLHHMGTSPHMVGYASTPMLVHTPLVHHQMMPNYTPTNQMHMQAPAYRHPRPNMQRHSTGPIPPRPGQLQRSHTMAGRPGYHATHNDVFGMQPGSTPTRRNGSMPVMQQYEYEQQQMFAPLQGISPARALGPAPSVPQRFSPHQDPMITPQQKSLAMPSSASSATTMTSSSLASSASDSSSATLDARRKMAASSDSENDSPTKGPSAARSMMKMHIDESQPTAGPSVIKRPMIKIPAPKAVSGGRTSAKFAKVAEDPGVEGVPDGPKSYDRPGPSFACIIGQAILAAKAGGLSLDHIYRYVETAYPYFGKNDGAWRNSVRHNLSIHKMFETIPRTEKFPPGKGGIWIIHEDEKCHWPSHNKFIKNFPASHPHHGTCRQTLHERAKEEEAMAKAQAEGKVYVPKKGKKARKLLDAEGSGSEMTRSNSQMSDGGITPQLLSVSLPGPPSRVPTPNIEVTPTMQTNKPLPPVALSFVSEHDFADDGDFEILEEAAPPPPAPAPLIDSQGHAHFTSPTEMLPPAFRVPPAVAAGTMVPPRFGDPIKKRKPLLDEENVFTAPKKVRVAEPLAPIASQNSAMVHDPDSYVTPERERPGVFNKTVSGSSAFKTPALINNSSSPGSSPMPPTIGRTSTHNPSALQQAWTTEDLDSPEVIEHHASPKQKVAVLDSAFDLKPKSMLHRRVATNDDDHPTIPISPRGPPRTPLTRSSAATNDRTPFIIKSPFSKNANMLPENGSPYLPAPVHACLSTPAYEIEQTLERIGQNVMNGTWTGGAGSPTRSLYSSPRRSPLNTDPSHYALAGKALASMMGGGSMGSPIPKGRAITTEPLKKA